MWCPQVVAIRLAARLASPLGRKDEAMNTRSTYNKLLLMLLVMIAISGCVASQSANLRKADTRNEMLPNEVASKEQQIKTIGIIGGVSWASSAEYYRLMNEMVREKLGGLHSAQILMFSIEFGEFSKQERMADRGDWALLIKTMFDAAQRLKRGGADFIVIASNTLNSQADLIEAKVGIPVIHIADATGERIRGKGLRTVALLGTKYTMEQPFYRERLGKYGIKVVTPDERERDYINTTPTDYLAY
ncbi:MAG: amino acid racemase [Deltaproteobacteria bacterium]|nr:amino acid racemase [Deltaproteobacteria bacterium]